MGQLEQGTLPWGLLGDVVPLLGSLTLWVPAPLHYSSDSWSLLQEEGWDKSESWGHPLPLGTASEPQEPPLPRILSGVGLAGGGAVTQFLGGFLVLPGDGGSFLDPKEFLGGDTRKRSKT